MPKISEYLTVAEAAKVLGVSRDTLRRWDRAGKLTARRHPITGYRLYLRDDLDQILRELVGTHNLREKAEAWTRRKRSKR